MVAVADPDDAGRARAKEQSGASRDYADYREMLQREELDIVAVCPRWLDQRLEMVLACLEAGCHVYCEKPFAISLEDGDQMVETADRSNLKIAVAHFHVRTCLVQPDYGNSLTMVELVICLNFMPTESMTTGVAVKT